MRRLFLDWMEPTDLRQVWYEYHDALIEGRLDEPKTEEKRRFALSERHASYCSIGLLSLSLITFVSKSTCI